MLNLGRSSGLRDWIIQRVSALLIAAYAVFLFSYVASYHPLYYVQWYNLFSNVWMKLATFVVLFAVIWHAWIGLWTVFTDYIKPPMLRMALEIVVILLLLACIGWGFEIMWAVKVGPVVVS